MSETEILVLVGIVGVLLGDAIASRIMLARLVKRMDKHEVVSAKLFVGLSADVCRLKERVAALEGKGETEVDE